MRTAAEVVYRALSEPAPVIRFLFLWLALEALFGPTDPHETSFRLSQLLALFLAERSYGARELFQQAKASYGLRSKIVHGLRLKGGRDNERHRQLEQTEEWGWLALSKILASADYVTRFEVDKTREQFLDELVFGQPA